MSGEIIYTILIVTITILSTPLLIALLWNPDKKSKE